MAARTTGASGAILDHPCRYMACCRIWLRRGYEEICASPSALRVHSILQPSHRPTAAHRDLAISNRRSTLCTAREKTMRVLMARETTVPPIQVRTRTTRFHSLPPQALLRSVESWRSLVHLIERQAGVVQPSGHGHLLSRGAWDETTACTSASASASASASTRAFDDGARGRGPRSSICHGQFTR
jgi:hypothetical protein